MTACVCVCFSVFARAFGADARLACARARLACPTRVRPSVSPTIGAVQIECPPSVKTVLCVRRSSPCACVCVCVGLASVYAALPSVIACPRIRSHFKFLSKTSLQSCALLSARSSSSSPLRCPRRRRRRRPQFPPACKQVLGVRFVRGVRANRQIRQSKANYTTDRIQVSNNHLPHF